MVFKIDSERTTQQRYVYYPDLLFGKFSSGMQCLNKMRQIYMYTNDKEIYSTKISS